MKAAGHRRHPRGGPPAAALPDPCRDRLRIGTGQPAQPRGLAGARLAELPLARALLDACHLGQQIGAPGRELAELGHRGGFLVSRQLAPACYTGGLCLSGGR